MDIMPHPAPDPDRVSAVDALLEQIPADLRAQLEAAFADDLSFMFNAGLDAGKQLTIDAVRKAHNAKKTAKQSRVAPRPALRLVPGGAL